MCLALFVAPVWAQTTYTLDSTDTCTQNDSGQTVYYGAAGDWMMIRTNPTSQGGDGFVKFDLSSIPNGSTVTGATLYLGLNSINEPPAYVDIFYGDNDDWSLQNLGNPIGWDPAKVLGDFFLQTGGFQFISIPLDVAVHDFSADLVDDALTVAIVADDVQSNPNLYFYLFGCNDPTWCPYIELDVIEDFSLDVSPMPLQAGQTGTFTASLGDPNTNTYLAYSLVGLGSTPVPFLNVVLDIAAPKQAGGTMVSDAQGTAIWNLPIPNGAAGRMVWVQAVQDGKTTNVVAADVL